METQVNPNTSPMLVRQQKTASYMLLATVLTTVVNIFLLLIQADFFIPYCASFPYYLTYLGYGFDGYAFGTNTTTGMVLAIVPLALMLLTWFLSERSLGWLRFGQILVIADTVFLAVFALAFLSDPGSCLFEGLLHAVVIYEIHLGLKAGKQLQQPVPPPPSAEDAPWDLETPTEVEYRSDLDTE